MLCAQALRQWLVSFTRARVECARACVSVPQQAAQPRRVTSVSSGAMRGGVASDWIRSWIQIRLTGAAPERPTDASGDALAPPSAHSTDAHVGSAPGTTGCGTWHILDTDQCASRTTGCGGTRAVNCFRWQAGPGTCTSRRGQRTCRKHLLEHLFLNPHETWCRSPAVVRKAIWQWA